MYLCTYAPMHIYEQTLHVCVYVNIHIDIYIYAWIYVFSTNELSSWSAKEGNKLFVLFMFARWL